jgi:uncharacterized protein (DUF1778 family)
MEGDLPAPADETVLQIRVSEDLKRKIMRAAFEDEQTLRCFVLSALKSHGVDVDQSELVDRRKLGRRSDDG